MMIRVDVEPASSGSCHATWTPDSDAFFSIRIPLGITSTVGPSVLLAIVILRSVAVGVAMDAAAEAEYSRAYVLLSRRSESPDVVYTDGCSWTHAEYKQGNPVDKESPEVYGRYAVRGTL